MQWSAIRVGTESNTYHNWQTQSDCKFMYKAYHFHDIFMNNNFLQVERAPSFNMASPTYKVEETAGPVP